MKVDHVGKYNEVYCNSCNEYDWGLFIELPSGDKICRSCAEQIAVELKVDELRQELSK